MIGIDKLRMQLEFYILVFKRNKWLSTLCFSLFAIASLIPLIQVVITKKFLDLISDLKSNEFIIGLLFIFAEVILQLLLILIEKATRLINIRISINLNLYFDKLNYEKIIQLPLEFFDDSNTYNIIQNSSNGIGSKITSSFFSVLSLMKSIITLSGYCIILIYYHWVLIIALTVILTFSIINKVWASKQRNALSIEQAEILRQNYYFSNLLINRDVAKEIKVFNHGSFLLQKWEENYSHNSEKNYLLEKKIIIKDLIIELQNSWILNSIVCFLLYLLSINRMTLGDYVALSQAIFSTRGLLENISFTIGDIHRTTLFLDNYKKISHLNVNEDNDLNDCNDIDNINIGIDVKDLYFKYHNSEQYTLKNISFSIGPNENIAIVGENGSGKTTLGKCILGLYSVDKGQVLFDNRDIRTLSQNSKSKLMTAVFQDFVKYNLTFIENISFGDISQSGDLDKIKKISRNLGIDKLINSSVNGLYTRLGPKFKSGMDISGGQWQNLAICRALYKNSPIILLDEPTSALDPLKEVDILNKYLELTSGKTSIIITHRLGICKKVDKIIVIKKGEIIEIGTHNELIQKQGFYFEMFKNQASLYQSVI
jgi:ATP-binding cassette subfamily B protein